MNLPSRSCYLLGPYQTQNIQQRRVVLILLGVLRDWRAIADGELRYLIQVEDRPIVGSIVRTVWQHMLSQKASFGVKNRSALRVGGPVQGVDCQLTDYRRMSC